MRIKYFYLLLLFALSLTQCAKKITIEEELIPPIIEEEILPKSEIVEDGLILKIVRATSSSDLTGNEIAKSFDRDNNTLYQTNSLSDTLTYSFTKAEEVDYFIYTPRTDSDDGLWGKVELWYLGRDKPLYEKVGTYDFKENNKVSTIEFSKTMKGVLSFRIVVLSGKNNKSSVGEVTFCKKDGYSHVFTDSLLSDLKPNITIEDINTIPNPVYRKVAQEMLRGDYDKFFRIQEYQPYPLVATTANVLKISQYNQFENPTGIYFTAGTEAVILVSNTQEELITLRVYDFNTNENRTYTLRAGMNVVPITNSGLGYVNFYTDKYLTLQPIKMHIMNHKINGYFDKEKHTKEDWNRLLNASVTDFFDIKGNYINLAYTTASLKLFCPDGLELINLYDEFVKLQFDIMGLTKYNRIPKNHMFGRSVESGLFADGIGIGLQKSLMSNYVNPVNVKSSGLWAIAHELGHVNQIRPSLRWVGTTEVTNNIYSLLTRYRYTPDDMNLEKERTYDDEGNLILGGRFNSFLNNGVVKGDLWQFQRGQDGESDSFVKLCPIWQLLLYYRLAEGTDWQKYDWFADLAEIARTTNVGLGTPNGQLQLSFMRNVCDILQEDLTDFFVKVGMLKPINRTVTDYTSANVTITQADCDALIQYAKKYKKPESPVIYYITANSLNAYQNQLPVIGDFNQGISVNTGLGNATVSHSVWKNVTVFETYKNNELVKVAMVGTNSPNGSTTLVSYPAGSTRIEAVAWDGTRTLVYGQR
ncbi:M60 family metallopeptidase [Sphingobacterium lumbrici]|uniref:M60 family metallopeptidase n=1 Tax=Sphingobacterium lumbrici TaxID=2559600 RepID=UPI00112E2688|nr:M60 family metallopeptidase [Sphingobacterium lumbrici]